ncbi:winged helix-turn-helix domain-containing protein [Homoserinibacter sp. YIM 151385]|uniref:winged helix-turn-helix domain-containing protein n=1 Tax=Homoserinibacter sp. YIM 151385 TaxID=2985506 RepID=UPI0022F0DF91|nr:helix-turn-helix domain-containing protein [Homoserinibacter sp. YIM 151385]WBU39006.1 helix-turn-helix domain-containing protein [Homoserinibacter sp. YIM 151385]
MDDETQGIPEERILGVEDLKGLAHPLRVAIYERVSAYGQATASGLAETLGESSGATSYHLRQLAKHGFVREVEGRGTGRERWWERVPGSISVRAAQFAPGSAGRLATEMVAREFERTRARLLEDFTQRGLEVLGVDWIEASALTTSNLRLTLEEAAELNRELEELFMSVVDRYRRPRPAPGARPVQVHLNLFPIVDGEPAPEDEPGAAS